MIYDILRQPVISEKSFAKAEEGKYVFWVSTTANKITVKEAVEKAFKVDVRNVNTLNLKGKLKSFGRKSVGKRKDRKKAIVTLKKGQEIKELKVG